MRRLRYAHGTMSPDSFDARLHMALISFLPFLVAVVFHEYGHALVARLWGDRTASEAGRLTMNPLPHLDPLGTVLIPLLNMISGIPLIGWAKPVPVDPSRFKRLRPGLLTVALAGPGMNFLMALVFSFLFWSIRIWVPETFEFYTPLTEMTVASIQINCVLALFNLLPLPPLDGAKVIQSFLPASASLKFEKLSQISFFILLALLFSGAFKYLTGPIMATVQLFLYVSGIIMGAATS